MTARILRRLARAHSGMAAVEFALLLPFMLLLLVGAAEIGNALLLNRKVTSAASTMADLVAQRVSVNTAQLTDVARAADQVIAPYAPGDATYLLVSVVLSPTNQQVVGWSFNRGGSAPAPGTAFQVPAGLIGPGESVIVAQISYNYRPVLGTLVLPSGFSVTDRFILKPRRTLVVQRV